MQQTLLEQSLPPKHQFPKINVLIPFCDKDLGRAIDVLEWAIELDGKVDYTGILHYAENTYAESMRDLANKYFSKVYENVYSEFTGEMTWPNPQNNAFFKAVIDYYYCADFKGIPFLWFETDGIPLCEGWLDKINQAHWESLASKKHFTGYVNPRTGNWNGQAVYPPNIPELGIQTLTTAATDKSGRQVPWDVAASKPSMKYFSKRNDVFQHKWGDESKREGNNIPAYTFPDWDSVTKVVDLNAAIFHRSKDGTLIQRLREQRNATNQRQQTNQEANPSQEKAGSTGGGSTKARKAKTRKLGTSNKPVQQPSTAPAADNLGGLAAKPRTDPPLATTPSKGTNPTTSPASAPVQQPVQPAPGHEVRQPATPLRSPGSTGAGVPTMPKMP